MFQQEISRRMMLLGAAAAAVAGLGGCGEADKTRKSTGSPVLRAQNVAWQQPAQGAPVEACRTGAMALANQLGSVTAGGSKNWIVSPLSIAMAFAMARVGAAGSTATQLDQVFGYPASGRDDAFNAIIRELATADQPPTTSAKRKEGETPPAPVVCLGNALFTSQKLTVGQEFLRVMASSYNAGVRPVDFTSEDAANQINTWVRQQTADRIKKLFDKLDPETLLVLANAIYFKGFWQAPFKAEQSHQSPFTRADGSQVTVSLMSQIGSFRYAALNGVQAVELPYSGGQYSMLLVLPAAGTAVLKALEPATVTALLGALSKQQLTLAVPKFDFATDLDLGLALRQLGLTVPFTSAADFSGISPGLFIQQAVHRANITVDEDGTEAAAVTGLAMLAAAPMAPELSFRADRSFGFVLLGGTDQLPLFVGQVNDPTAK